MFRKTISIVLCSILLLCMSVPAFATPNETEPAEAKTVEEILNEYHEKAYQTRLAEDANDPAVYSRQAGGNSKTLEEETVDELTSAGYEAYNVTSENYDDLEATLMTDFSDMGIESNSSYIIVVTGDGDKDSGQVGSRSGLPPEESFDNGGYGSRYFSYTYGGSTYYMRHVTVTPTENNKLRTTSDIDILNELKTDSVLYALYQNITFVTSLGDVGGIGTAASIISHFIPDYEPSYDDTFDYQGATSWIVTYTQIYDSEVSKWVTRSSVEYATMQYFIDYTYYDSNSRQYERVDASGSLGTVYSDHYSDGNWCLEYAVLAHTYGGRMYDTIDTIEYKFGNTVVITHDRWMEYVGYEP